MLLERYLKGLASASGNKSPKVSLSVAFHDGDLEQT